MFIIAAAFISLNAGAAVYQKTSKNFIYVNDDEVVDKPDVLPEFPGGMNELMNFIRKNVKYPADAQKNKIEGKVVVEFVVTKDGSVRDFNIISKTPDILNKEALRVVKSMPKWKPGKKDGKIVNVHFVLPIAFKLQK